MGEVSIESDLKDVRTFNRKTLGEKKEQKREQKRVGSDTQNKAIPLVMS